MDENPATIDNNIALRVEARRLDLLVLANCHEAVRGFGTVYNLAADRT